MNLWLLFSGLAYVLTTLSFLIIWRKAHRKNVSLFRIITAWPFIDKALGVLWAIQLVAVFYTQRPESFALNSVLLLYLVSRINREILKMHNPSSD